MSMERTLVLDHDRVQRKLLRGGQRTFSIRLRLGTTESLLGASASEIAGGIVPLEDLWGDAEARRVRAARAVATAVDPAPSMCSTCWRG